MTQGEGLESNRGSAKRGNRVGSRHLTILTWNVARDAVQGTNVEAPRRGAEGRSRELSLGNAGQIALGPGTQFVHRGNERHSGGRQRVDHRYWRTGSDITLDEPRTVELAEPFSENGVADSLDSPTEVRESCGRGRGDAP